MSLAVDDLPIQRSVLLQVRDGATSELRKRLGAWRVAGGDMVTTYLESFEQVWESTTR